MKTIEQAIEAASKCLEDVGIQNPRLESEYLVAAFLQVPRTHLVLQRQQSLTPERVKALQLWLRERQKRKPLAYVSGEQPFRDLHLKVNSFVLIPRPETELLVEQAFRILDSSESDALVVDVGTGSGNIALSLSAHPRVRQVIGIDVSKEALSVARANARETHRAAPIEWVHGHLLEPLRKQRSAVDLIIANLPYVRTREFAELEPEIHWEPRLALDGGPDGLRLIEPCITQAADVLWPGGTLLLEIGADQHRPVLHFLEQNLVWTGARMFRDFSGLPRIIQVQRKGI